MNAQESASSPQANEENQASEDNIGSGETRLELFFDLVFVFAFTQVTGFLADHLTWIGMLQGAVILAALWWAWVTYSWLTSAIPAEDVIPARLIILSAMAAMLIASLAVPNAFSDDGVLFGSAYFAVRLLQIALYVLASRDRPEMRRGVLRLAPGFVVGPALLVVAGFLDGTAQGACWVAGFLIDYGVAVVRGVEGLRLHAEHFAERHGSVIIIALGESITAIGAAGRDLSTEVVLAALAAIALSAALAWTYFDYAARHAEQKFVAAQGQEQTAQARDSYSYIHLPMVAGIILVALGFEEALAHVGNPLHTIPAIALCAGAALYLLALNAFRLRNTGTASGRRLVVTGLCCALVPIALQVSALVTLAILAGLLSALGAVETMYPNELRRNVR